MLGNSVDGDVTGRQLGFLDLRNKEREVLEKWAVIWPRKNIMLGKTGESRRQEWISQINRIKEMASMSLEKHR